MKLSDIVESKDTKKVVVKSAPPRNFVAKNAKTSGAGSHTATKFSRKEKHKDKVTDK